MPRSFAAFWLCVVIHVAPAFADDGSWGHLGGRFVYGGEPPILKPFEVTKDVEGLGRTIENETLLVHKQNRGLANVVIYLLPDNQRKLRVHSSYDENADAKVSWGASRGRWSPRVVLLRTTQTLVEDHRDSVAHNANYLTLQNRTQGALLSDGRPVERRFTVEEPFPATVACNIHPWESAFLLVRSAPYMALSDTEGRFEIKNLPAGEHLFQIWHERTGYLREIRGTGFTLDRRGRMTVSIRPSETTRIDASAASAQFKVDALP